MAGINLAKCRKIIRGAFAKGKELGLQPLSIAVLDAGGNILHELALPRRGAMPVPTIADVNGDGQLEIIVSLKDAEDSVESVRIYTVPGSQTNCLLWPTGRANYWRNGTVR